MIRYCHKSCGLAIRINPITILNYVEKLRFEGNLEQQQQQQNRLIALISLLIMYEHEIFIIFVLIEANGLAILIAKKKITRSRKIRL